MTVDPRAASGFGGHADIYERGRPGYPAAAIARLAGEFGISSDSTVLDLAAGTGKLSRSLIPLAGRVIAVEPLPAMREELRRQLPGIEAHDGTAEAIPLPDQSVDSVFVGEAFHWFQTEEALAEIARILRPGGGLALLWNGANWTEAELAWVERLDALVIPKRLAAGPFPAGDNSWKPVLEQDARFEALREERFAHVHRTGVEDFLALVASWSWIANLPGAERGELLDQVRELAGAGAVLELPYSTETYWTRRVDTVPHRV